MRSKTIALSLFSLIATNSMAIEPLPLGPQFVVNSYTTDTQWTPGVTALPDESFVVTWTSEDSAAGDPCSIEGQRFDSTLAPVGGQFAVGSFTTNCKRYPAIATLTDGSSVVAWVDHESTGGDGSGSGIQARFLSTTGLPLGDDLDINSFTTGNQSNPAIVASEDGGFLVVWRSDGSSGSDTSGASIQARAFSPTGVPLAPDVQVNSHTPGLQDFPSVARSESSEFVVVWGSATSSGSDSSSWSIQKRNLSALGSPVGVDFQVNSFTSGLQMYSDVATTPTASALLIWNSEVGNTGDNFDSSIQGRRFDAAGEPDGDQYQLNSYTPYNQRKPSASAADADGEFVVVWTSEPPDYGPPGSPPGIQARRFSSTGSPLGPDFVVGADAWWAYPDNPKVAAGQNGDFLVVWNAFNDASGSDDIFARGYRVTGDLVGRAFSDLDADGIQDANDPGLPGVTVEQYDEALVLRRSTVTGPDGEYTLKPKEGTWTLRFIAPGPPWVITTKDVGGDDEIDSDADPSTGFTDSFPISINTLESTIDAGFHTAIFIDGFESGDSLAWSSSSP
jgi:hypothetical protein